MMKIYKTLIATLLLSNVMNAQAPDWSVNSSDFENSMNIVAVMITNGVESTSDQNLIVAFVGNEVRGVASTSVLTNTNRKVAFLQVYSNSSTGEMVSFRLYNAASNSEIESVISLPFGNNDIYGTTSEPLVITDNVFPKDIFLSPSAIEEERDINSLVGVLSTIDDDSKGLFTYSFEAGAGDDDNEAFVIHGDTLRTNEVFDFEIKTSYLIRLVVEDEDGNTFSKLIKLDILPINEAPEILYQELLVKERSPIGTVVGLVAAVDVDGDAIAYSILTPTDVFSINPSSGEITVLADVLDFETQDFYSLEIEVIDPEGLSHSSEIGIIIEDVIDPDTPLSANDFISANDDGFNDVFFILNVGLYQDFTLAIYNNAGIAVFSMTGYDNTWSGTDNSGRALAAGAYYYSLSSPTNPISFKGSLTLVR